MLRSKIKIGLYCLIIAIVIMGFSRPLLSQEIRYDDLYARLSSLNPNQAYTQLLAFQQQNPFFSNTYIQLGRICELKLTTIDPLRDIEQANYWANNAVLFYNLFTVYLKDGDVRRNREYYANILDPQPGKKIEQEEVIDYLQKRLRYCQSYKDTVALVYKVLERSKEHYNNCVQIFNDINVDYNNLNIALLRTDSTLLGLLDSLNAQFVASIDSFKVYQVLISKFPVANYRQQFSIKPIETFRLDGITNSDFLNNSFTLWDYRKWVEKFKETYTKDIIPLRREISSVQDLFMSNRRKLSLVDTLSPNDRFKSFDDFFLFRLGKYDNNSIVRQLFQYHNCYQDLLVSSKSSLNGLTDSSLATMNKRLRYYYRLALEHKKAQSELDDLSMSIDSEKVLNHKEFFSKYYNGTDGLKSFTISENEGLLSLMNDNFERLSRYMDREQARRLSFGYAVGRQKVPLQPNYSLVGPKTNEPFIVYSISYLKDKPYYVGGYLNKPTKKPMAFIAKVDSSKTVEWTREVGAANLENGDYAKHIYGFDNGCVAIVTGKVGEVYSNTYVRVDSKSGVVFKKPVDETSIPCFLQFDEITQNALLGFGELADGTDSLFSSITISQLDSAGVALWKSTIPVKGNLVDLVKADDKLLAFVNYQAYQDDKMGLVSYSPGAFGHLMAIINSSDGKVDSLIPIKASSPYTISKVFSISSSEINLIGQIQTSPQNKLAYIIISSKGNVIYSNF